PGDAAIASKLVISLSALGVAVAAGGAAVLYKKAHSIEPQWAVIEQYCVDCHDAAEKAGDRNFDQLLHQSVAANAEAWEAAIRKLQGGMMPPAGQARPDAESVSAVVKWLSA